MEIFNILSEHPLVLLSSSRGPLSALSSLDVMWVSFYAIGLLLGAILFISAIRKWIHNSILAFICKFIAYAMFMFGSFLMVLVVATWPN
jgi:hypothetical protein